MRDILFLHILGTQLRINSWFDQINGELFLDSNIKDIQDNHMLLH